jgi:purine/pyrimidine-nucleoside phosphorylase
MKHNSYFEGKVQSLGITTPEGYATVGVIESGQYTFSTDSEEHLSIIAGSMKVKLPGSSWRQVSPNDTFVVPPQASFDIDAPADVAYICYYK